eukprot:5697917-Amphidinium_carterae.1
MSLSWIGAFLARGLNAGEYGAGPMTGMYGYRASEPADPASIPARLQRGVSERGFMMDHLQGAIEGVLSAEVIDASRLCFIGTTRSVEQVTGNHLVPRGSIAAGVYSVMTSQVGDMTVAHDGFVLSVHRLEPRSGASQSTSHYLPPGQVVATPRRVLQYMRFNSANCFFPAHADNSLMAARSPFLDTSLKPSADLVYSASNVVAAWRQFLRNRAESNLRMSLTAPVSTQTPDTVTTAGFTPNPSVVVFAGRRREQLARAGTQPPPPPAQMLDPAPRPAMRIEPALPNAAPPAVLPTPGAEPLITIIPNVPKNCICIEREKTLTQRQRFLDTDTLNLST